MHPKITPSQLRELIDELRLNQLRNQHIIEYYEAIAQSAPVEFRKPMQMNVDEFYATNRIATDQVRKQTAVLEQILNEDEALNGWKGADRYVQF